MCTRHFTIHSFLALVVRMAADDLAIDRTCIVTGVYKVIIYNVGGFFFFLFFSFFLSTYIPCTYRIDSQLVRERLTEQPFAQARQKPLCLLRGDWRRAWRTFTLAGTF
ncbi:hypothetical protein BD289DRAFT_197409 [Coniella lustricola]|uniref:Secreted protein n=1 Tax=Coniella lustricola TaxID=2025994 RepID=A0A2T2ZSS6_9PEZI|nr:hypothetical protein BD289DRAFT_197409 [Coniella lustricola]